MTERKPADTVAPHPVLTAYYQKRSQQPAFVRGLFNDTAPHYNTINSLFSFGSGGWYHRRCLRRAGLGAGMRLLDVAVGTGLVAEQAVTIVGNRTQVIGLDLSESMLVEARRNLDIPLIQGDAERLPIADSSVDFVSMGYALRHVSDLVSTFREFHRVLKPSGSLLLLEISKPANPVIRAFVSGYLGKLAPMISRLATGQARTQTLMSYYWETIENCVPSPVILQAMGQSGFTETRCETDFDLFRGYFGRKP